MLRTGESPLKPFELFYDPLDMTTCVPGTETVAELNKRAKADNLYFPLYLTEEMALGDLVLGYRFTSRSFRFGPLCDNVLGFNFVLASGQTVKVGAQVVKNVTGFDLARFLTNSGYRFGKIERVILRLRAMAEGFHYRAVAGNVASLNSFRKLFLASPKPPTVTTGARGMPIRHTGVFHHSTWSQILDGFDFETDEKGSRFCLSFSCNDSHVKFFDTAIGAMAEESGCEVSKASGFPAVSPKPFARVKTLISRTLNEADSLVDRHGGRAHGYIGNAFFHYDPPAGKLNDGALIQDLQEMHVELGNLGGHVRCDKLTYPTDSIELRWEKALKQKWEALA